jgi:glucose/arabinose dehydrogenase
VRRALLLVALLAGGCGGGSSGGAGSPEPAPLPEGILSLAPGYAAETVAAGLTRAVRLARAPDGRIFLNELDTGDVRIVEPDGTLAPVPFAHVDVLTGGHRGLLGLALAPDFEVSNHVFVAACVPAAGGKPDRTQVLRWTDAGGVGTNRTVVVDDLPVSTINDGGDLCFGTDGTLFVSVGDAEVPDAAQTDGALAGRVLRYTAAGAIPADNPVAGSPEWCRGLRNTFALAVHPVTGDLFGADNGPASDDELNYLQPGKNFGWPTLPPGVGPSQVGFRMARWIDVIVPTALAWHPGGGAWADLADDLLLASYGEHEVRRILLSGVAHTDLDGEEVLVELEPSGEDNRPLDLLVEPGGNVLVLTFTRLHRILRAP